MGIVDSLRKTSNRKYIGYDLAGLPLCVAQAIASRFS